MHGGMVTGLHCRRFHSIVYMGFQDIVQRTFSWHCLQEFSAELLHNDF
jgi:hypothetical protein